MWRVLIMTRMAHLMSLRISRLPLSSHVHTTYTLSVLYKGKISRIFGPFLRNLLRLSYFPVNIILTFIFGQCSAPFG